MTPAATRRSPAFPIPRAHFERIDGAITDGVDVKRAAAGRATALAENYAADARSYATGSIFSMPPM